jgi:hypothetical protein
MLLIGPHPHNLRSMPRGGAVGGGCGNEKRPDTVKCQALVIGAVWYFYAAPDVSPLRCISAHGSMLAEAKKAHGVSVSLEYGPSFRLSTSPLRAKGG